MSLPVHWVPSLTDARPGAVVQVEGDEAHHAVAVRRLRVGERLALTDGLGTRVVGEVAVTGKRRLEVRVVDVERHERPAPSFTVVQALPKGDRGELAVEVLTEVGVDRVVPWGAARSVAVWKGERAVRAHGKWAATAREAAKQSRRSWFPEVSSLASTAEVADLVAGADLAVVLHEDAAATVSGLEVPDGRVVVVVGPEGGLTDEEVAVLEEAGARTLRLGTEVLRTSTAGVVAVGALMARTARWA
ncbi:16S rRNA (uracil(1498)-N(3))-methyltransferase [Nocardioides solisilvae]|uniref:16S rRNA (uracil(1498)-N(3))-methyltransferase n=1 Tax=Nocardioides solisilvae TaxID=1542435 RepID=UPI000D745A47|nr:16S rRNA (uracil(1498)-N(3))-methyltransferase [Nocardioides solisilvae]